MIPDEQMQRLIFTVDLTGFIISMEIHLWMCLGGVLQGCFLGQGSIPLKWPAPPHEVWSWIDYKGKEELGTRLYFLLLPDGCAVQSIFLMVMDYILFSNKE